MTDLLLEILVVGITVGCIFGFGLWCWHIGYCRGYQEGIEDNA